MEVDDDELLEDDEELDELLEDELDNELLLELLEVLGIEVVTPEDELELVLDVVVVEVAVELVAT